MLMENIIGAPEHHWEGPGQENFGPSSIDEGWVLKKPTSSHFVNVSVSKHGRMLVEVPYSGTSLLGRAHEVNSVSRKSILKFQNFNIIQGSGGDIYFCRILIFIIIINYNNIKKQWHKSWL